VSSETLYGALPIAAQNVACTWAGWRRARARFTPHFHRTLAQWMETGRSSTEALQELQQDRLLVLANRARRFVPHFAAMDLPEFEPDSDASRGIDAILSAFPVIEKSAYREAPETSSPPIFPPAG
jgi:hypothetical protein